MRRKKVEQVNRALLKIERYDPHWNQEYLMEFVEWAFIVIQDAWSRKDRKKLRELLMDGVYRKWKPMLDRMDRYGQRNIMKHLRVRKIQIIDVKDYTDDQQDRFTVRIRATAVDYTIDRNGKWTVPKWKPGLDPNRLKLTKTLVELWTFQRDGEEWKLGKVDQTGSELNYTKPDPVLKDRKYRKQRKRS